jgi:hypothetical protein
MDLIHRLRLGWRWVVAQFVGTLLLILLGIAWTRLPEKHVWQVLLSLLLPLLLTICALWLQAGTMRSFAGDDGKRVKLVLGAMTLLIWMALFWACWAILDWCDDRIPLWAGYLNSQAPAHARAKLFTYEHIQHGLLIAEWVMRWVVVPAKIIPYTVASAQWGWRLPVRRVLRILWNWRWWPAVVLAALLSVWLPGWLFAGDPHGTVSAQIWHVSLKLIATYLLALGSWVLLLGWAAVLFERQRPLPESDDPTELFKRLYASRRWVGMQFGWVLLWIWVNVAVLYLPGIDRWPVWLSVGLGVLYRISVAILALVVQAGMMRKMISNDSRRVHLAWGTLAMLLWSVVFLVADSIQASLPGTFLQWAFVWLIAPVIYIPFAAASAMWGLRLPWRRVLRVVFAWRWWLGVIPAGAAGALTEIYIDGIRSYPYVWDVNMPTGLKMSIADMLEMGVWILLLGWFAVLFNRILPPDSEALVEISGPLPETE